MTTQKITPFLWFNNQAEEAVKFYTSLFKGSRILHLSPLVSTFELEGQKFMAINGGPHYKFTEAVSFYVSCETQEEVDYFWDKLTEEGAASRCGWLKDKYGLSWQIIPSILEKLMSDPDKTKSQRVMESILKMNKIIVQDLLDAYEGKVQQK